MIGHTETPVDVEHRLWYITINALDRAKNRGRLILADIRCGFYTPDIEMPSSWRAGGGTPRRCYRSIRDLTHPEI